MRTIQVRENLISKIVFFALLFVASSCQKNDPDLTLSANEVLFNQFVSSAQFLDLKIEKSLLSHEILTEEMPDKSKRIHIKFLDSDLKFVIGKFGKNGEVNMSSFVQVIPNENVVNSIKVASENFENHKFDGEIIIKIGNRQNERLKFDNSEQTNKLNSARGCDFGEAFYRIGGFGWGGKIGCFVSGLIGCLIWNHIDCITA
jgi:hypothetical protein